MTKLVSFCLVCLLAGCAGRSPKTVAVTLEYQFNWDRYTVDEIEKLLDKSGYDRIYPNVSISVECTSWNCKGVLDMAPPASAFDNTFTNVYLDKHQVKVLRQMMKQHWRELAPLNNDQPGDHLMSCTSSQCTYMATLQTQAPKGQALEPLLRAVYLGSLANVLELPRRPAQNRAE